MTVAIDIRTGAIVGQVTRLPLNVEVACRTPKNHPERFAGEGDSIRLLTRDGYQFVSAASVRLEEVR